MGAIILDVSDRGKRSAGGVSRCHEKKGGGGSVQPMLLAAFMELMLSCNSNTKVTDPSWEAGGDHLPERGCTTWGGSPELLKK